MQKADILIRTKLRLPFTRPDLVSRPRLQERLSEGLNVPLTLVTAPAGFGKTSLVASYTANCGLPVAWLSLDKDDNQVERFLSYWVAALQEADNSIGSEAVQLLAAAGQASPESILSSLINDLDSTGKEIALVLDDYQFISSRAVHDVVAFFLDHCPNKFHLLISTRSDPPLPLARLRARGQTVELRTADLRFTEAEAAQFLNGVMALHLDPGSISALEDRTEGWIAGLQMAALSMRDRKDVFGFIEGLSGTNRYILDYLLEEVLSNQPLEIQRFLLYTSILERLSAPLCDAISERQEWRVESSDGSLPFAINSQSILEYLERANLFLIPLDDERIWYRYHLLFADLLRTQLQKSIGVKGVALLHQSAAEWCEQNSSILDAIHHASMASNNEMVERLIEQHYMEMVNRGEMSWVRFWMGKLSKELIYRRPWLCLYQALNRSWFGQLEEANSFLNEAEKRIRAEGSATGARSLFGYHAYVKSRITAMQGDTRQAIEYCLSARENISADNLALQNDVSITLGYEYFLYGDFTKANEILGETIRAYYTAGAVNNPVAAYAILARMQVYQGHLHEAFDLLQKAAQLIQQAGGQYLGSTGLVEVGIAALLCEWNDVGPAFNHIKRGLDFLPLWGKADDFCLAYLILSRLELAQGNLAEAAGAVEKAVQLVQTSGLFSEARRAVEATQVKMWLDQGDWSSVNRWVSALQKRFDAHAPVQYEDELTFITQARVFLAQDKSSEAIQLLSSLAESARSAGRAGRLLEILILKALAMQRMGETTQAYSCLTESLALAEPEGYLRIFLDKGLPMQTLLTQWLRSASAGALRDYAVRLLAHFDAEQKWVPPAQDKAAAVKKTIAGSEQALIEPLSQRELEVLHLIALGKTNQEIARQLIVSPGTVKAHTASIYRKLDVANRTEAVARARQLGILP